METALVGLVARGDLPLETSLVEWKRVYEHPIPADTPHLGNFLSGMETFAFRPGEHAPGHTLETSLVEWKPGPLQGGQVLCKSLETSLVEWKHVSGVTYPCSTKPWKLP